MATSHMGHFIFKLNTIKSIFIKKYIYQGAGEMVPWVKCLLDKHEELSSDPQHPQAVFACSPALEDRDSRADPRDSATVSLTNMATSSSSERPCLKN